jgi:hypothetical protein
MGLILAIWQLFANYILIVCLFPKSSRTQQQPPHPNDVVASPRSGHGHQDSVVAANRNSMHEHSRSIDFNSPTRAQYNGGDMNARNMGKLTR